MHFQTSVSTVFDCSVERAFKTAILCDLSKIHTGFIIMPKVTHVENDADWGKVGSSKDVYVGPSMTQKGGYGSKDHILERVENDYWRIQVDDFQTWMLGFYKFEGKWKTTALSEQQTLVEYAYNLHSNSPILYPINWLFAKTFWRIYMKRVLTNIKVMAYNKEPYQYD